MTRPICSIQPASEEFGAAVRWYEERRRGLGAEFFDAVSGTIVAGVELTRRILVGRFPHQVVYRFTPTEIVIVAVAHLKRRPNYWKHRH